MSWLKTQALSESSVGAYNQGAMNLLRRDGVR